MLNALATYLVERVAKNCANYHPFKIEAALRTPPATGELKACPERPFMVNDPVIHREKPYWNIGVIQSISDENGMIYCHWRADHGYFQAGCLPGDLEHAAEVFRKLRTLAEQRAYYRAWDIARGTNAGLCKTAAAAYSLIVGELRKLVGDGPASLRASPDQEVEELRFWLRKAGEVLAPHSADPAGTPTRDALVFVNAGLNKQARTIVRQALTTQEDHRNAD